MSGQPAARLGDLHTCPMVDPGPKPHVGGPILGPCAPTVIIGRKPAAKLGDTLVCIGPFDTITKGSAAVFIDHKPAARLGDSTAHGGVITVGCPTVIIGDGTAGQALASIPQIEGRMQTADLVRAAYRSSNLPPPGSRFSDEEKLALAQQGQQEKYVIRVTKTKHTGDAENIGPSKTYWTTTYAQLEHAGSDTQLLCQLSGKPHEPNAEYSLIVIDTEAGRDAGMKTFIPTYTALGDFAAHQLENPLAHPALIPEVLNDDYAKTYAALKTKVPKNFDPNNAIEVQGFAKKQNLSPKEADLFETRYQLYKELGANEHYLGNGTTKNLAATPNGPKLGVVETFTYDKNPKTLGDLEKQGVVKRIKLGK